MTDIKRKVIEIKKVVNALHNFNADTKMSESLNALGAKLNKVFTNSNMLEKEAEEKQKELSKAHAMVEQLTQRISEKQALVDNLDDIIIEISLGIEALDTNNDGNLDDSFSA